MKDNATQAAIRHVDIVVSSMETSLKFYRELLRPFGWTAENTIKGEKGEPLTYLAGPGGFASGAIGIRERQSRLRDVPYDRYDLGLHHIAINVPARDDVDSCANWLKSNGHKIEDGPAEFYNDRYYAVFFYDPDGIKLEVVCGA
ncbi:MAG TPA: VOC family protein [Candidatus Saccharimonadales bacterium]|nr:VOC family protein [Candidatus Saccharimonadales bacterium]